MADPTTDAFLQGQGIPVDPGQIENELIKLWGPAAERVGGPEVENPTVTRIVLANLVVGSRASDAARVDGTLDTVVERYPCRAIVLRQTDETDRKVSAEVSALCHLPAPGMPQVCSERIVLRTGAHGLDLLPAEVRSLLEADLPFVLWWTYDPREAQALFLDLADECSRLILDLPDPGADPAGLRVGLDLEKIPYARDISWFGISRWRELVAQFFDGTERSALDRLTTVEIRAEAPQNDRPPRVAAWLAGWLAGQLGWKPDEILQAAPGRIQARFQGPSAPVEVTLSTTVVPQAPFGRLTSVILTTAGSNGPTHYRLERPSGDLQQVQVKVDCPSACVLPHLFHAPVFDAARRVAAALESSRRDPPYCRALPNMFWLLEASR